MINMVATITLRRNRTALAYSILENNRGRRMVQRIEGYHTNNAQQEYKSHKVKQAQNCYITNNKISNQF